MSVGSSYGINEIHCIQCNKIMKQEEIDELNDDLCICKKCIKNLAIKRKVIITESDIVLNHI